MILSTQHKYNVAAAGHGHSEHRWSMEEIDSVA